MFKSAKDYIDEDKINQKLEKKQEEEKIIDGIKLTKEQFAKYKMADNLNLEKQKQIILTCSLGYEHIPINELEYLIIYDNDTTKGVTLKKIERSCREIPFEALLEMEKATKFNHFDCFYIAYPDIKRSGSDRQILLGVKEINQYNLYFLIKKW